MNKPVKLDDIIDGMEMQTDESSCAENGVRLHKFTKAENGVFTISQNIKENYFIINLA